MNRSLALACVVAALGCGRIGYDAVGVDAAGTTGAAGAAGTTGAAAAGGAATGGGGGDGGVNPDGISMCTSMAYNGHDYLLCEDTVDWPTARAYCEARAARLVRIDDLAENNWLVSFAAASPSAQHLEVWIGAYEPTTDGDWRWTDGDAFWLGDGNGAAVGGRYANWGRTEPNDEIDPEACAVIQLNSKAWYDFQCKTPEGFICEAY